MSVIPTALTDRRRAAVVAHPDLNGIDFVEVADDRRTLLVHFLKPVRHGSLDEPDLLVQGGERPERIDVLALAVDRQDRSVLRARLARGGDRSRYTLQLLGPDGVSPPEGYDPVLATAAFRFLSSERDAVAPLDCGGTAAAVAGEEPLPAIDYLAKDFASFRQLMLERMAFTAPAWQERSAADLGLMLVELLAYAGDYLSYRQDAIATEAYLNTARLRTSLRRHARLADYTVDDGCNARTLVQIDVGGPLDVRLPRGTVLLTAVQGYETTVAPEVARSLVDDGRSIGFETLEDATLRGADAAEIPLYAWGARDAVLPAGSTSAVLPCRAHESLRPGAVVVLVEPREDGPDRVHPVRLTAVTHLSDPLGGRFAEPPNDTAGELTHVAWSVADATPVEMTIARTIDDGEDVTYRDGLTVVRTNVVFADQGTTLAPEPLAPVSGARYRPRLGNAPLTFAAPFDPGAPTAAELVQPPGPPVPQLVLTAAYQGRTTTWTVRPDLLESGPLATDVTVESEDDGSAALRFGDGELGRVPDPGAAFTAVYRVGTGSAGNVRPGAIGHVVAPGAPIRAVRNLLAGSGGREPETAEHIRAYAPGAHRIAARAVVAADFAALVQRRPEVLGAAAEVRWAASRRTAFVTVDLRGGVALDPSLRTALLAELDAARIAGLDVELAAARPVPLEVELALALRPGYRHADVHDALRTAYAAAFAPDLLPMGAPLYASRFVAAAMALDGVADARLTVLRPLWSGAPALPADDVLRLAPTDKPRLDDDPRFPDRGVLRVRYARRTA